MSFIYEDICREKILDLSHEGVMDFTISRSGKWWDKTEEIDIVALSEAEHKILLGECNYTEKKVDADVYYTLKEKSKKVKWLPQALNYYFIFSKSGFTDTLLYLAERDPYLYLLKT